MGGLGGLMKSRILSCRTECTSLPFLCRTRSRSHVRALIIRMQSFERIVDKVGSIPPLLRVEGPKRCRP